MIRTATFCASVAAFASIALTSVDASACGGFFCGGQGPQQVNQAAERIVFAEHADGRVTAVIQILYNGPADRFGWLLPVPGIPEVGLSSDAAFTILQNATNPQYSMNTTVEGTCKQPDDQNNAFASADAGSNAPQNNANDDNEGGGVTVVDAGSAGPYDYVVIQVDSASGDKAQLALDWLEENNFQVTDVGPDLLVPYLDENYNLLAIRLQKSQDAGSVRPLRLTYDTDHPMIPIKLTAVAATEDMGVMTWLLGPSRAVPVNYKSLEINDALLNWFNPAANYNNVVIAAANEASGQGFVTEYAQPTSALGSVVYTDNDEQQWTSIVSEDWTGRELDLMLAVFETYAWNRFGPGGQWDGLPEAFDAAVPGMTTEERMNLLSCGPRCVWETTPEGFEVSTFLTAVDDFVVGPMRETQELMDEFGYITRMYTTLSAHEMTLDPSFDYNADLEDVSNVHTAERIIECHPDIFQQDAPWRAELPSGLVVRGTGNSWPIQQDEMMPATLTVSEVGTSGGGDVVRDNLETVRQQLDDANAQVPTADELASGGGVGKRDLGGGNSSCATVTGESSWLLLLLAFFGLRRRS